jgi:tripartite-type tricarboxylate transporter receptor subunit TctC
VKTSRAISLAIVAAFAAFGSSVARAQTWPTRTVKIVVPFAPGGAIDVMARLLATKMQDSLKQPVIVENRAGVGGNLGADYVAKQPADGYTILYNTNGQAISPATYKSLPFDPFRDFAPVTQIFSSNLLLVASPKLPVKGFQEFVSLVKANPGKFNYGSSGVGNPLHLTMELLKLRTGMDIQMVAYKSDGEIINAVLGAQIDAAIVPVVTGKQHVLAGAMKGLGVTAAHRAPGLDVPTIAEQGLPDFDAGGWQGLFMAAKTPPDIVARVQLEAKKAFDAPDMAAKIESFGLTGVYSTPEAFADFYRKDVDNFKRVVREAKIPLQE